MNVTIKGSFLLGGIALAGLLGGCAADNPWGTESDSKGKIRLSLETDGEVKDVKPIFRSGEKTAHIVPEAEDFSIKLEKLDGSMSKTYDTLADFKAEEGFAAGSYKISAYYGDLETEGIDAAYYAGEATVQVLADRSSEAEITTTLKNTEIQINYTENFKNYFSDWTAKLHTEGYSYIDIPKGDESIAYIAPGDTKVGLTFKTNDQQEASVYTAEFQTLAKQRYNVTFDFSGGEVGTLSKGQIQIIFDDELTRETVEIDLTDELFVSAPPSVSLTGGNADNTPIEIVKGTAPADNLKFNILCAAGLTEANLTIASSTYTPDWGKEINLCSADAAQQAQLSASKINCIGLFNNPDQMAVVDITGYVTTLPDGNYTITMMAVDKLGRNSDAISVDVVVSPVRISFVSASASFEDPDGRADATLSFEGAINLGDLKFYTLDGSGSETMISVVGTPSESTRASETHTYNFKLQLIETSKSIIPVSVKLNSDEVCKFNIPVSYPRDYTADTDAYSYKALVRINPTNSSDLTGLLDDLKFQFGSQYFNLAGKDISTGILTFSGFTPGRTYDVRSSINGILWKEHGSATMESAKEIPNGDFSKKASSRLEIKDLVVGGEWTGVATDGIRYTHKSAISLDMPESWATINDKTAWSGSTTKNTWFVVASSWLKDGKGMMRNVAYDHAGTAPTVYKKTSAYYNGNQPSSFEGQAAGELFLGSYSFSKHNPDTDSRTDGISFESRFESISFDYEYAPSSSEDQGYVIMKLYDKAGNLIQETTKNLPAATSATTISIPITNYAFGSKVSKLVLGFKSSNQTTPPVTKPSETELSQDNRGHSHGDWPESEYNNYHALATGSVLKIDNVKAHYDYEPTASGAPKRATSKKIKK